MEKSNINVFQIKGVRKDFGYKISSADVYNQFLYIGDQKGTIYSYPFRSSQAQVISKNVNQQSKKISSSKIDKILCYAPIATIIALTDEKLFAIDSALKKSQQLAAKIHDFAINQSFVKEGGLYSVVAISKKKEGFIFYYNPNTKKLQDSKAKFNITDIPSCVGYTGDHIVLSYKKDYQVINIPKSFAVKKGVLSSKNPFIKVTGQNQILFFSDDIGIFMDPEFHPKQKDNIAVPKPIISITICGLYCLILYEGLLQIYTLFDPKKFTLVQQLPVNNIKGLTSDRPFVYSKDDLFFLYEIPYQTQIKALLQRCRVEQAIMLLIQNVGDNQAKIQELKMNAVWPLIKRMYFEKAKDIIQSINFDVRQIVLLFPEMVSIEIDSMKSKADKTMITMISQFVNEKANRGANQQADLKKKSKIFLKEILQIKRQSYVDKPNMGKMKIQFNTSKNSLIKPKLPGATQQELLEIIDFSIIKWFIEMKMFRQLQDFFLANPMIYCKRLFDEFESMIKSNDKIFEFPNLIPRFYTAFDRTQAAYEAWRRVAQSQKDAVVKTACEEAVKLLTQFQNRQEIYKKLSWILQKKPEIGMSFFNMVPTNFIQPDQVIRNFEQDKSDKYLELYLEIIVIQKNTEIQAYHTKLLLIYIDNLFKIHPKENKEQGKGVDFQQKLAKMRKLLKSSNAKYNSEPILRKIEKCEWLMEDQIYLYSREKRHDEALRRYISKSMAKEAEKYCLLNKDQTLTIYFKMQISMYKSYELSKNSSALLVKKDIISFLKRYSSNPQLDSIVVLELIPQDWMLNDIEGIGGIYQFLESAITHTLHQKRTNYTSKHLSEMDLLNVQYNLIQAKRAYLRFTYQKKCAICQAPIADKFFVVYPNANVCHQACVKKEKNTVCPITKQDFQKTFKY